MNMSDKRKKRLLKELEGREYRDSYVSSNVDVGIAFQIRALRKQRGWSQEKLAEMVNMKQERISVLENPSNTPAITTLKKMANALDIGLIVRFAAISDLVKWQYSMSEESLEVLGFDDDPYFKETKEPPMEADSSKYQAELSILGTAAEIIHDEITRIEDRFVGQGTHLPVTDTDLAAVNF